MAKYIITAAAPPRLGDHRNTGVGTEIELSRGLGEAFVSMHWLIDPEAEACAKAAEQAAEQAAKDAEGEDNSSHGGAPKGDTAENPENTSAGSGNDTVGGGGSRKQNGRPAAKK